MAVKIRKQGNKHTRKKPLPVADGVQPIRVYHAVIHGQRVPVKVYATGASLQAPLIHPRLKKRDQSRAEEG